MASDIPDMTEDEFYQGDECPDCGGCGEIQCHNIGPESRDAQLPCPTCMARDHQDELATLRATNERLNSELTDALTDLDSARQDNASLTEGFKALRAEVERQTHALTVAKAALADDASKALKLTASSFISHVLEHSTPPDRRRVDNDD